MSSITGYNPATVPTLASGTYRHVALSISGTVHTLYLDGSMVAQNLTGGNVFASYTSAIQNLYIGCAGDLSYGLTGSIDDFKVWNRVLPATDISAIFYANYVPVVPFTPTVISGIYIWLDGSDPNGNGNKPVNNSVVNTWYDKSGFSNNMTSKRSNTTYISNSFNGLGTMYFNMDWFQSVSANAPYPIDVYVIVKLNNYEPNTDIVGLSQGASDNFNSLTYNEAPNTTSHNWHNGSSGFSRTPNTISTFAETSTFVNSFLLMQWSIKDNSFYIYRNGVQISNTSTYTWSKGTPYFQVGNRVFVNINSSNLRGYVGEVIAYNNQLNNYNRQQVEGYLAWKWGLQTSLPVAHPYYSASPKYDNLLTTAVIYFPLQSGTITNLGTLSSLTIQNGTNNTYATVGGKTGLRGIYTNSTFMVTGINIPASYTISVWFYCISWSGAFFGTCVGPNIDQTNLITFSGDNAGCIYYRDNNQNAGVGGNFYTVPAPQTGVWNHFVITIDATNKVESIYRNATLLTTISLAAATALDSMKTIEYPHYPKGTTDSNTYARQFCVFNRVLTQTEVSTIYNMTA